MILQPAFWRRWGLSTQRSRSGVIDLLSVMWLWMMEEKWIGFELMEPLEKMSTIRCAHMPKRIGVNASHVGGDGWAITDASSPHLWWKTLRFWEGGLLELCAEENHVASEMNWIDVFEAEASCTCCRTAQTYIYSRMCLKTVQDICWGQLPKAWDMFLKSHVLTQWE